MAGCNFHCPYCHNPELARGQLPQPVPEDKFFNFLADRKGLLDGVVITGGEPTLSTELAKICEKIKQKGYLIKLDTNGSRPLIVKQLINNGLIDYVALDIKTDPAAYVPALAKKHVSADLLDIIKIIMKSAPAYEFRTTCFKPLINESILKIILKIIEGAKLYVLQQLQFEKMLNQTLITRKDLRYSSDQLHLFKKIAEQYVQKCIIR